MKYSVAIFTAVISATILISCADVLHAQQVSQLYAVYSTQGTLPVYRSFVYTVYGKCMIIIIIMYSV